MRRFRNLLLEETFGSNTVDAENWNFQDITSAMSLLDEQLRMDGINACIYGNLAKQSSNQTHHNILFGIVTTCQISSV